MPHTFNCFFNDFAQIHSQHFCSFCNNFSIYSCSKSLVFPLLLD
ncbi:MAG TPA: hypothetical protein DCY71_07100 [Clostridiaceae bacterium]|nr:hypothetical protein [Clostridiaceae bacterium]